MNWNNMEKLLDVKDEKGYYVLGNLTYDRLGEIIKNFDEFQSEIKKIHDPLP